MPLVHRATVLGGGRADDGARRAGSVEAWAWSSDGKGEFTVAPVALEEAPARGTRVTLHLMENAKAYAERWTLERIVKEQSGHVTLNIGATPDVKVTAPQGTEFSLKTRGAKASVPFEITIPRTTVPVDMDIHASAVVVDQKYAMTMNTVAYPHIQTHRYYTPAQSTFKILDLILVMTEGGPGTSTLVISQFIYQKGFQKFQFGYASAASVVLFLICIVITIIQFVVNKRRAA